jgi:hypothetical protein
MIRRGHPVNTRKEAIELASAHLRDQGSALLVRQNGLRRDKRLGLWHVGYYHPEHADELLCGGGLAVWDGGRVEPVSSADPYMVDHQLEFLSSLEDALALPDGWHRLLGSECHQVYRERLQIFLRDERQQHTVYPPEEQVFSAFRFTRYADTRAVILGQDPYHQPGQAHGLCFSVPERITRPRSLINIHRIVAIAAVAVTLIFNLLSQRLTRAGQRLIERGQGAGARHGRGHRTAIRGDCPAD